MKERFARLGKELHKTLSFAGDLILLNLLCFLCCLPVVTVGASIVACYSGVFRLVRKKETGLPIQPFFRDFAAAFKTATAGWLCILLSFVVLAGDAWFAVVYSEPDNTFFLLFAIVLSVIILLAALWFFPLVSRFENKLGGHIKNAFLMAFAKFPKTLAALLIWGVFLAVPVFLFNVFVYFGWVWLLFGISLPAYWTVKLLRNELQLTVLNDDEEPAEASGEARNTGNE